MHNSIDNLKTTSFTYFTSWGTENVIPFLADGCEREQDGVGGSERGKMNAPPPKKDSESMRHSPGMRKGGMRM